MQAASEAGAVGGVGRVEVVEAEELEPLVDVAVLEAGVFFGWFGGRRGWWLSGAGLEGDEVVAGFEGGAAASAGSLADLAVGADDGESAGSGVFGDEVGDFGVGVVLGSAVDKAKAAFWFDVHGLAPKGPAVKDDDALVGKVLHVGGDQTAEVDGGELLPGGVELGSGVVDVVAIEQVRHRVKKSEIPSTKFETNSKIKRYKKC